MVLRRSQVRHLPFTGVFDVSALPSNSEFVQSNLFVSPTRPRMHVGFNATVEPIIAAITDPPRVRRKFSFAHDDSDSWTIHQQTGNVTRNKNSRLHEQQVAKWLNRMIEEGELQGTPIDPSLGYQCDDPAAWNTVSPSSLKEAIDRIAAALKTLMGGIP